MTPKDQLITDLQNQINLEQEKQKILKHLIKAAYHLLLAAEGPEGGPTNWQETRETWTSLAKEHNALR